MNRFFARLSGAFVLGLLSFGLASSGLLPPGLFPMDAWAQDLPRPREFYFEADTDIARPLELVPGSDDATVDELLRVRDRGRRDAPLATAQLARISYAAGRTDVGAALYEEAKARPANARQRDAMHWNHGWDLYRSGDVAGALEQWRIAGDRLKGPSWLPPTLALGLWKLDRRDEAVRWYAASVRTEPRLWTTPDLPRLLPDWTDEDRAVLAEVAAAWRAAPPSWP